MCTFLLFVTLQVSLIVARNVCVGNEKVKDGKPRPNAAMDLHRFLIFPVTMAMSLMADWKCTHCLCVLGQLSQLINYNQVTNQGTGTPIRERWGSGEYQLEDLIWL